MPKGKLLFITARTLWPVDSGRKTSLTYYCRGLHERYGYDVYLYCFANEGDTVPETLPGYIKEVRVAKPVGKAEAVGNCLLRSLGKSQWPFQCSLYYSKENNSEILGWVREIEPDVVFAEMIRTSLYLEGMGGGITRISNLDDLLSKRYLRQARFDGSDSNVAGAYAARLPKALNALLRKTDLKSKVLRAEARRCSKWERAIYDECDYVMFTSHLETDEINAAMGGEKAITLSVGVDFESLSRSLPGLAKEPSSVSFLGNFSFAPNCESLRVIVEEILPQARHEASLKVIGSVPAEVKRQYEGCPNVEFVGRVDDLARAVRSTQVFLSPISFGTGIKTKIVEAMAMGMPVVTNEVGAEGIGAVDGEHMAIANDASEIASRLDALLEDGGMRARLGEKAQRLAYERFRWDVVYSAFDKAGL